MTDRNTSEAALYLSIEGSSSEAALSAIETALSAGPVRALLITQPKQDRLTREHVHKFLDLAKTADIPLLVENDAGLAKSIEADGVHLSWQDDVADAYKQARDLLGAEGVIGVDVGRSRHLAMELGEAGADYIAFGIPEHVSDRDNAQRRQRDLIAWWAEIFEPPCVAIDTHDPKAIAALVQAGADFIVLPIMAGQTKFQIKTFIADQIALLKT